MALKVVFKKVRLKDRQVKENNWEQACVCNRIVGGGGGNGKSYQPEFDSRHRKKKRKKKAVC